MQIISKIYLDFGRSTLPITVFAKQYDQESRFVEIAPLNLGQPYELEDGVTARLQVTKADSTQVINDATITDGKIYAELTAQALAAEGVAVAEIALYKNASLLTSQSFYIEVKSSAYNLDKVKSSDEYKSLIEAFNAADNLNAWVEQTATGATIYVTDRYGVTHSAHIDTLSSINGWDDIKYAVRNGLGEVLFPVGYEFTTPRETAISAAAGADNTGVTAVTVNEDAFLHAIGEAHGGVYEATYDGAAWHKENGETVVLADYGISVTGTPRSGDTILITETATSIIWVVRGHNHHQAADGHYTHTMTLEAKYVYGTAAGTYKGLVFDAAEALYYCEEALPAGTYNFTWNYATDSMVNGTYQFTLAEGVPAGGQIVLGTNSNSTAITSCKIKTYASVGATAAIESNIAVTAGSGGTSLGTIGAATSDSVNLNCAQRIMWGSNNYAQSAARQWLNSSAKLGSVWTPTNKFDRAPSWHTGSDTAYHGFMHGLGDDFLAAVQPAKLACRTNSVFEVNSLDGTEFTTNQVYELEDKFFLLSRPEIWGTWDSATYKDGTQLEYYEGLTQTELIKRDAAGSARYSWLRSPTPSIAYYERLVYTDGSLSNYTAINANAVAPACIIA